MEHAAQQLRLSPMSLGVWESASAWGSKPHQPGCQVKYLEVHLWFTAENVGYVVVYWLLSWTVKKHASTFILFDFLSFWAWTHLDSPAALSDLLPWWCGVHVFVESLSPWQPQVLREMTLCQYLFSSSVFFLHARRLWSFLHNLTVY